ncbi:MAG TPA: glutamine synthetase family protein [Candidatus Limnocylindrales bacterium]|nr:glutamine synthetase family protein [Candidatus Limnocylindrales bacterium]
MTATEPRHPVAPAHGDHDKPARLAELEQLVRDGAVDTLVVAITDMQGRLVGKRVQADAFLAGVIDHGAHFCTYLLGTDMEMNTPEGFTLMNWETGYGDWIASPVWDTLRVLPWLDRTALVLGDAIDEETHEEIPISPRTLLKQQVAKAAAMGIAVKAGSELEYYITRDTWDDMHRKGWVVPEPFGYYNEDYQLLQATKAEPIHRLLRNLMTAARIPIEFSKGEAAPGQHEVNIRYDHVLESADRTVIFKHGAKEIAYLNGWGLTFMAKPDHTWTGSSGHLHMSIWGLDDDVPLMAARDGEEPGPYGLSKLGRHFVAGMMALSRELAPFLAPNVNSYKRFAALSWAPVNVVWGRDNRTTGFRLVGHGSGLHVENRFPGGDMNAYLTYAAAIGAGLYGIEHELELPAEYKGNGYVATGVPRMPRALWEAIIELERSSAAREIFGDAVVDHYLNAARVEQQTYDAVVHPWDRQRYLERG